MRLVTGIVTCLQVEDDIGFTGIQEDGTNIVEYFVLWSNPGDPSAFTRIMQTMWLSFLKESLANGNQIEMNLDDTDTPLYVRIDKL